MMSELITFRTGSGTSFQRKVDDPLVSTLLSMYDEFEVPSVVELQGSVGEIVDEEYAHFERLMERRKVLGDSLGMKRVHKLFRASGSSTKAIVEKSELRSIGLVYLHQVSRIVRVLDVDEVVLLATVVDASTPLEVRMRHYKSLGNVESIKALIKGASIHESSGVYALQLFRELMQEGVVDEVVTTLRGLIYNSLVLATNKGTTMATEVVWEDVLEIVRDVVMRETTRSMLNFLSGRGNAQRTIPTFFSVWYINVFTVYDAPFLLSRAIALLPEDVSPNELGIAAFTDANNHYYEQYATTPALLAQQVMGCAVLAAYGSAKGVGAFRMTKRVANLEKLIGRYALARVLLSLLHYLEKNPDNEVAEAMSRAIERRLG